jgi:hypothetical protein
MYAVHVYRGIELCVGWINATEVASETQDRFLYLAISLRQAGRGTAVPGIFFRLSTDDSPGIPRAIFRYTSEADCVPEVK